ncbi:hypothetical protein DIE19_27970 [Burkholderia sp. Bp9126]|nr:hypothetical protein DIE19_27970 [Burkholderia sp. Bp9126]
MHLWRATTRLHLRARIAACRCGFPQDRIARGDDARPGRQAKKTRPGRPRKYSQTPSDEGNKQL